MNRFVYLDNNATTKINEVVLNKIKPYLEVQFGNPSSQYLFGKKIKNAIEDARQQIAKFINCTPKQVVFTSGGSEGNCAAINSAIKQYPEKKKIITTKIEHSSILEYCKQLEKEGYKIIYLDVDINGVVDIKQLDSQLDEHVSCVSIQYANNETGAITDIQSLHKIIKHKKRLFNFVFHSDMVQALGKIKLDMKKSIIDVASFSGHKIHTPKGIGSMFVKEPEKFVPLITGHQEHNLRGGTENVIGIVALGAASQNINGSLAQHATDMLDVRNYLEQQLLSLDDITINCYNSNRLPNTVSVTFAKHNGNDLMFKLEKHGICVSTGSACNSNSSEPSHVLTAMKIKNPENTIRISIDETTTKNQIDYFIKSLRLCL